RRYYAPLRRARGRIHHGAVLLHDSSLEPLADQADEVPVGDALLQHADKPVVVHVVEEALDVGFHYPMASASKEPASQLLAGGASAPSRSIAHAVVREVRLEDRFEQSAGGHLDDFVLQGGDAKRTG